jgi:hypothetical protein
MNKTQIASAVVLSAFYDSPGIGEISDVDSNDVDDKVQPDG